MEQYALYLILRDIVASTGCMFKCSFNDMNSNADNVTGIYIKGAEPSSYRTLGDGEYYNIINRVQFLIQGGLDNSSLMSCLRLGSDLKNTLIKSSNKIINATDKIGLDGDSRIILSSDVTAGQKLTSIKVILAKVDMLSDLVNIGKSEQGRPRYSINFRIHYEIGGR